MGEIKLLLVDDDPRWRDCLVGEIRRACAEEAVCVVNPNGKSTTCPPLRAPSEQGPSPRSIKVFLAASYEQAKGLLDDRGTWKLLVTELALGPALGRSGVELVRQAREEGVPCLVVGDSMVMGVDDVSELFRDYRIYDFFLKKRFDTHRFQGHIRSILDPLPRAPSPAGPDPSPIQAGTVARPREVTVGFGDECYTLHSEGFQPFTVPRRRTSLFACFVRKVYLGAAGEEVDLRELNEAVGEDDPTKASPALRKAIWGLNTRLHDEFGPPSDGEPWIKRIRGGGYLLNTSRLRWVVDLGQLERRPGRSIPRLLLIGPHRM